MATASITFCRAHVPGDLNRLDRETFPVRTCVRLRWRAHGEINPGSQQARNPASHQSTAVSTPVSGVIATFLPEWRSLRTAFERTRNPIARAVRIFLQGHAGTSNLCRAFEAAGKPFLRALFQSPEKPLSVAFVLCRPNPSLLAVDHGNDHDSRRDANARNLIGEVRNVVR